MDKTDRLRDYGLAFLLYEQGLGICGYELIRELFIFIKLILNSYLLEENRRIHISKITDIIRLSLREYIYVVLCNKEHKLHIKFGYDYYLNVSCSLNCETLKNIVCREGLYLDPR